VLIAIPRLLILMAFTAAAIAQCRNNEMVVLTHHRFADVGAGQTTVTTDHLRHQLDRLEQRGYRYVALDVVEAAVLSHQPLLHRSVSVTADDGHESIYTILFPIIRERHIPLTLFIYPSIVSRRADALTWNQLREMQSSGSVRIQSHTFWHPNFRTEKKRLSSTEYEHLVEDQLIRSKTVLERELGKPVRSLAWPYGIYDRELQDAARSAGYQYAYAFDGKPSTPSDDPYAVHRIPVPDSSGIGFISCEVPLHHSTASRK